MSASRWVFVLAALGALGACSDRNDATGPNSNGPPLIQLVMRVDGPQDVSGEPGETLADFPRVLVTMADTNAPVAGVSVTFSTPFGGPSRTVITDAQGVAHFGKFTFGTDPGIQEVVAVAERISSSLIFSGYATSLLPERYDLQLIGGRLLPQDFPGRKIVGGHYLLMTDGTYHFYYDVDVVRGTFPPAPFGRYIRSFNTIDFYVAGPVGFFYQKRNSPFSRGTLEGGAMQVLYEDYIDFENEVYVRR
ncbi:MAG: hypothetical protein ABJC63_04420 [Gemmatimonadales bacterium]